MKVATTFSSAAQRHHLKSKSFKVFPSLFGSAVLTKPRWHTMLATLGGTLRLYLSLFLVSAF